MCKPSWVGEKGFHSAAMSLLDLCPGLHPAESLSGLFPAYWIQNKALQPKYSVTDGSFHCCNVTLWVPEGMIPGIESGANTEMDL